MKLLSTCLCGHNDGVPGTILGINVDICGRCGVIRQSLMITEQQYYNFYTEEYHSDFQQTKGVQTYKERYDHDKQLAAKRFETYKRYLTSESVALDIGSSNNAFVDYLNEQGIKTEGIEIGEEGQQRPDTTYNDDLLNLSLPSKKYTFVTLHDVLEHLINPKEQLVEINRIMDHDGVVVIDFPHFYIKEGYHHWKPVEHLWFLTQHQVEQLLTDTGFDVVDIDYPISSKFVVYARKVS